MKSCLTCSKKGLAPVWTIVIASLLISFNLLIYTGLVLQNNFRQVQSELERAANMALDANLQNKNVRDLNMTADHALVLASLESHLNQLGFSKISDQHWQHWYQDKLHCEIFNLSFAVDDAQVTLSGILQIPLLWGPETSVRLPFTTRTQAIFIEY